MSRGRFVRTFNPVTNVFDMVFGTIRIEGLVDKDGQPYGDDPLLAVNGGKMSLPVNEMVKYLKNFYWPRRAEMRKA
jgi:hypothetical protein